MNIKYSINIIEKNDLQYIEHIGKKCLPIYYSSNDLSLLITNSNYILYKVSTNDHIFGFIIAQKKDHNKRIHILSLAVLPKFRRLGFGKQLLNKIKNYNYPVISLFVLEQNLDAVTFYYKQQFVFVKTIYKYYKSLNNQNALFLCYIQT